MSFGAGDAPTPLPPWQSTRPLLVSDQVHWAEGPAANKDGVVFLPNYHRYGAIGRIEQSGDAEILVDFKVSAPGRKVVCNGLKVDNHGDLLGADMGSSQIVRIDTQSAEVETVIDQIDGEKFPGTVNDLALDPDGNIYFSITYDKNKCGVGVWYAGGEKPHYIKAGTDKANGIALSPDGRNLVVSCDEKLLTIDLDSPDRTPRVLIDFQDLSDDELGPLGRGGSPDGMAFDEFGRLFVATWGSGCVRVVSVPDGRQLAYYPVGSPNPTNVHFCSGDLIVTCGYDYQVVKLPLGIRGYRYSKECGY